jgi:hypothetical protein
MNQPFVRLRRLYGKNFRGLVEPFSVTFPEKGMVLLKGVNQNTGDSSDSGKSSLLLAISHLFGGCPFPGSALQSWFSEEPYLVGAELETPEGSVKVERSKGLTVKTPANPKGFKGKEAEAELDRIFGMDAVTRALVTYRRQGQRGLFMSMSDPEKKNFLARLLRLGRYEDLAEEAIEAEKALVIKLDGLRGQAAAAAEATLAAEKKLLEIPIDKDPDTLLSYAASQKELAATFTEEAKALKHKIDESRRGAEIALEEALAKLREERLKMAGEASPEVAALEKELAEARAALEQERKRLDSVKWARQTKIGSLKAEGVAAVARVKAGKVAQERLASLRIDEERLERSICPTCERPWLEKAQEQLEAIRGQIAAQVVVTQDADAAATEIQALKAQLAEESVAVDESSLEALKQAQTEIETKLLAHQTVAHNARKAAEKKLQEREAHTRASAAAALDGIISGWVSSREIMLAKVEEAMAMATDLEMKAAVVRGRVELRADREHALQDCRTHQETLADALAATEFQANAERDLAALVGRKGFLGLIVEDVLSESAAAVNEILSNVANVRHVSFDFETEK